MNKTATPSLAGQPGAPRPSASGTMQPDTENHAAQGCCGGSAPEGAQACCALDVSARSEGKSGCGCEAPAPASAGVGQRTCCA